MIIKEITENYTIGSNAQLADAPKIDYDKPDAISSAAPSASLPSPSKETVQSKQGETNTQVGAEISNDKLEELQGQQLVLPYPDTWIRVGFDAPAYICHGINGLPHYGIDLVAAWNGSDQSQGIYASGDGNILGVEYKTCLGWVLLVQYDNIIDINGSKIESVLFRYCHLAEDVKSIQTRKVAKGEKLATQGGTGLGAGEKNIHLHLEVDTDITSMFNSISDKSSTKISVIDPLEVLYVDIGQTFTEYAYGSAYKCSDGKEFYNQSKVINAPKIDSSQNSTNTNNNLKKQPRYGVTPE